MQRKWAEVKRKMFYTLVRQLGANWTAATAIEKLHPLYPVKDALALGMKRLKNYAAIRKRRERLAFEASRRIASIATTIKRPLF
jgi:hypothetical protein